MSSKRRSIHWPWPHPAKRKFACERIRVALQQIPASMELTDQAEDTEIMVQTERGMKAASSCFQARAWVFRDVEQADMKELRDVVTQQSQKVQAV